MKRFTLNITLMILLFTVQTGFAQLSGSIGSSRISTVGNIKGALQQCLYDSGYVKSTVLTDIVDLLDCSNKNLINSDIDQILNMPNLTGLNISNNLSLTNVSALGKLRQLISLDLSNNTNLVLPDFSDFSALQELYLNGLGLSSAPNLSQNNTLVKIELKNNQITAGLDTLPQSLQELDVTQGLGGNSSYCELNPSSVSSISVDANNLNLADCSAIQGLSSINVTGGNFPNTTQDISSFIGDSRLFALTIDSTNLKQLDGTVPVCAVFGLKNNSELKYVEPLRNAQGDVIPVTDYITLIDDDNENLLCSNRFEWAEPISVLKNSTQSKKAPVVEECPQLGLMNQYKIPDTCSPDPVQSFNVYSDSNTQRRFLTWTKDPNHNYSQWGVSSYELKGYDKFGTNISTKGLALDVQMPYITDDLTAASYSISACTMERCGYETTVMGSGDGGFEQGLTRVHDITQQWDTTSNDPTFKLNFTYPDAVFNASGGMGKPDYFIIKPEFDQGTQGLSPIIIPVSSVNNNTGTAELWEMTTPISRSSLIGDGLTIAACSSNLGCGVAENIVLTEEISSEDLPIPKIEQGYKVSFGTNLDLTWTWDNPQNFDLNSIDYIEIIEKQPVAVVDRVAYGFISPFARTEIKYYSDNINGPLKLNRQTVGLYSFKLRACIRNRETGDVCSVPYAYEEYFPPNQTSNGSVNDYRHRIERRIISGGFSQPIKHEHLDFIQNIVLLDNSGDLNIQWNYAEPNGHDIQEPDYYFLSSQSGNTRCIKEHGSNPDDILDKIVIDHLGGATSIDTSTVCDYFKDVNNGSYSEPTSPWKIQACMNGVGCSNPVTIDFGQTTNTLNTVPSTISTPSVVGGPGDMNPGLWWNPAQGGTGWQFYWASELRYPSVHENYGNTYDLLGYWFAYEEIDGVWTPVWFFTQMKQTQGVNGQSGFFQGDLLYLTHNSSTNSSTSKVVGQIELYFDTSVDNQHATMRLDLDYDGGIFSQQGIPTDNQPFTMVGGKLEYQIQDFDIDNIPETGNDSDHYSGVWFNYDSNGVLNQKLGIQTWIEDSIEVSTVATYDNAGKPLWLVATTCTSQHEQTPDCNSSNLPGDGYFDGYQTDPDNLNTYALIYNGFNPLGSPPNGYIQSDNRAYIGRGGRDFTASEGFRNAKYWLNIPSYTTPVGDRTVYISSMGSHQSNMKEMRKIASLHDIRFFINDHNETVTTCDLNDPDELGECLIKFAWFTDDDFISIEPYFTNNPDATNPTYTKLSSICPAVTGELNKYVTPEFYCDLTSLPGDYKFQLRKNKHIGSGTVAIAESNKLTIIDCNGDCSPIVGEPSIPEVPTSAVERNVSSINSNDLIGNTSGVFNVDGSGGASYSIPIFTPSGRGGISPELSLNYSSQAGNGIAGMGWNLSGISSISRCLKNKEQDPNDLYYKPISMTNEDAFCLDGARLYYSGGGSGNGTNEATYRTELESFSRITSISNSNNGPDSFKIEGKDGDIRYYGSSSDDFKANSIFTTDNTGAQILSTNGTGTVSSWLLNKITDRNGNQIWFVWDSKEGESYLKQVRWTMAQGSSKSYKEHYRIDFNYVDRTIDKQHSYQIESESKLFKLLDSVTTSIREASSDVSLSKVRELKLTYETSTSQQNRIVQIEECAYKNTEEACHQPVVFEWDENEAYDLGLSNKVSTTNIEDLGKMGFGASKPIDINGDGKMELIFVKGYDDGNIIMQDLHAEFYIMSNDTDETPFTGEESVNSSPLVIPGCKPITYSGAGGNNKAFNKLCAMGIEPFDPDHLEERFGSESWFVYDFNGDGYDDLLSPKAVANRDDWWIFYSNGKRICVNGNDECNGYAPLNTGIEYLAVEGGSSLLDYTADGLVDFVTFVDINNGVGTPQYKYKIFPMVKINNQYKFDLNANGPLKIDTLNLHPRDFVCPDAINTECVINFADGPNGEPGGEFGVNGVIKARKLNIVPSDFNGDGYNDALLNYTYKYPDNVCGIVNDNPPPLAVTDNTYTSDVIKSENNTYTVTTPAESCEQKFSAVMLFDPLDNSFKYGGRAGIIDVLTDGYVNNNHYLPFNITCDEADSSRCKGYINGAKGSIVSMDVNGDGLSDIVYKRSHGNTWEYKLNLGSKTAKSYPQVELTINGKPTVFFEASNFDEITFSQSYSFNMPAVVPEYDNSTPPQILNKKDINGRKYLIQFMDYDDDGDIDILYPELDENATGTDVHYLVRTYNVDSPYSSDSDTGFLARKKVEKAEENMNQFFDLNGDSYYDQFVVHIGENSKRSDIYYNTRPWKTRNKITSIITGGSHLNYVTYLDYESGILPTVYDRSVSSLNNDINFGQGSPVFDILSPQYLVRRVRTTAPIKGNGNAISEVYYHYSGLKIQGGGRGGLGFATVSSYDPQRNIRTQTDYNQSFPFIGMPNTTITDYFPSGFNTSNALTCTGSNCPVIAVYPVCNAANTPCQDPITSGIAYNQLTLSENDLDYINSTSSGSLFVYIQQTVEHAYRFDNFNKYKTKINEFNYHADVARTQLPNPFHGNLIRTNSYTCDGSSSATCMAANSSSLVEKSSTVNSYAGDSESNWLLGRLSGTTVTSTRKVNGVLNSKVNTSSFSYDTTTGQLIEEIIEPTGNSSEFLRTFHKYDNYGNETHTIQCSKTITQADCLNESNIAQLSIARPSDNNYIYRYKISNYDSQWSEYVDSTVEPFTSIESFSSGSTVPNATVIQKTTSQVIDRDIFGNPTKIKDIRNNISTSAYGKFGELHASATDLGGYSYTLNAWCTPATCPTNALVVSSTITEGAPITKKYADQLGREVRSQTQNLNGNWVTVDTWYDKVGRTKQQTNPYIVSQSTGTGIVGALTTTNYDDLNRVTSINSPSHETCIYTNGNTNCTNEVVTTLTSYAGLTTTITKPITTANPDGEVITKTSDASGKVIRIMDNNNQNINYYYDAKGNLIKTMAFGSVTTINYDKLGRKINMTDPDKGYWEYTYNALGELITQEDSNSNLTQTYYDIRGRMYHRTENSVWSLWEFDNNNSYGLLTREVSRGEFISKGQGQDKFYHYDNFGRIIKVDTDIYDGLNCESLNGTCSNLATLQPQSYTESTTYDQNGRIFQSFDASGQGILYQYNAYGFNNIQRNAIPGDTGQIYYEAKDTDQWGNITEIKHFDNFTTEKVYSNTDGMIKTIRTSLGLSQDLSYAFDSVGNLIQRADIKNNTIESYSYDLLNRLNSQDRMVSGINLSTINNSYADNGNLLQKGNQTLSYNGMNNAGPHAVDQSDNYNYIYDNNGNMTAQTLTNSGVGNEKEFYYTAFNKPYKMISHGNEGIYKNIIGYNLNRSRYFRHDYSSNILQKTTHYVGNVEFIVENGITKKKSYLGNLLITKIGNIQQYRYLLKDNLGSITTIVDETGAIKENMSFDAWGQRRNADFDSLNSYPSVLSEVQDAINITTRGFTGHEQFDQVGVIHMNGRIYDASIGRFLQADPIIQDPYDTQSLNRYSYVGNNPLSYTDPTGYSRLRKGWWRAPLAIAITVYTAGAASSLMAASNALSAASTMTGFSSLAGAAATFKSAALIMSVFGGTLAGGVATGNLKGAVKGGLMAGVSFGIGHGAANGGSPFGKGRMFAHAIAGGASSMVDGDKFGHGFAAAGLTGIFDASTIGKDIATAGITVRIVSNALVGGSVSQVTGGKFANGAMSAAFRVAFNELQEINEQEKTIIDTKLLRKNGLLIVDNQSNNDVNVKFGSLNVDVSANSKSDPFIIEPSRQDLLLDLGGKSSDGARGLRIRAGFRTEVTVFNRENFISSVVVDSMKAFAQSKKSLSFVGNSKFKISETDVKPISYQIKVMGIKVMDDSISNCGATKNGCN